MKYVLVLILAFLEMGAGAQTIGRKAVFGKGQQFEMTNTNQSELVMEMRGQKNALM